MKPEQKEVWMHYKTKGGYEILTLATLQSKDPGLDMTECVIYKSLLDDTVWVRPLNDFIELVSLDGVELSRFEKVR